MLDNSGRAYAKIDDVKVGSKLECDGGFDCMKEGEIRHVQMDRTGELYIRCKEGDHALCGQIKGKHYVGLYPA